MENQLWDGTALLSDARTLGWCTRSTIPGSVDYSFTLLSQVDGTHNLRDVLQAFGDKRQHSVGAIQGRIEERGLTTGEPQG
jgi:hypothetical protein